MKTLTVRMATEDHRVLSSMSKASGESLTTLLGRAVRLLKAQESMRQLDEDYTRLRVDSGAWQGFRRELDNYDVTIADGLEPEDWSDIDFVVGDSMDSDSDRPNDAESD